MARTEVKELRIPVLTADASKPHTCSVGDDRSPGTTRHPVKGRVAPSVTQAWGGAGVQNKWCVRTQNLAGQHRQATSRPETDRHGLRYRVGAGRRAVLKLTPRAMLRPTQRYKFAWSPGRRLDHVFWT